MSQERLRVAHGEAEIAFSVSRRPRKTLSISVEPDASVAVVAPIDASTEAILDKVKRRAAWVLRQQRYFAQFSPRTPERRFVPGETHLYLGRQYRLKVIADANPGVKLVRGFFVARSRQPEKSEVTRALLEQWARERARAKFRERLEICLKRFRDPEAFRPKGMIVRRLKQRWGSMSPSRRLLLNLRLIQAPVDAIDYVITHELCHIAEPHHGSVFFELLGNVMNDWKARKARLERTMA